MVKKDKQHTKLREIYKAGEKYHCAVCGSEVHYKNNCPTCKKDIDWEAIRFVS